MKESDRYPDDAHDRFAIERFHWAKGVALRHLGRIREAQTELHLVFTSQLDTNPSLAITTLPSLVETMRECGDFAEGLAFLEETAKRANNFVMVREQLRIAMWRGVFNKNLMQDAIQFRWNESAVRFVPDMKEVKLYRRRAENAFAEALAIGATMEGTAAKVDVTQVHSEMAETALWYSICWPDAREEADRRLEEFSLLLSFNPIAEQQVEYHRYCAQRAALDSRFDDARAALEMARNVARVHGMSFLEADCDMDWARFIMNSERQFPSTEVHATLERVRGVAAYYHDHIGGDTYYAKIAGFLITGLAHKILSATLSS